MQLFTTLLLPLLVAMTSATKIQYYKDGGCTDYAIEFKPPMDGTCWNYQWGGTHSANIAACTPLRYGCYCTFYQEADCSGGKWTVSVAGSGGKNCASNWAGGGFKSMQCGEY